MTEYVKFDTDKWDDCGVVYALLEYHTRPGSTAVDVVVENPSTGEVTHRVVASHQIEFLEAKDW